MSAFDLHFYPNVLSGEVNSKFTKIEHSYFIADLIWRQDIPARMRLYSTNARWICDASLTEIRLTPYLQPYELGVITENS